MQGLAIFIHAVRMVIGNFGQTLRIGGVALAVMVALTLSQEVGSRADGTLSAAAFLLSLALMIVGLWVAVAWHRFILIEETPGTMLPAWNGAAIWAYFRASFKLGLVLALLIIPLMLIVALAIFPMMGARADAASPGLAVGMLAFVVTLLPAAYVFYRLSPVLPGAATDRPMTLREAWYQTATGGWTFVTLALTTLVAGWALDAPVLALAQISLPLALIWSAVAQWLAFLVGASILTTLYGHYIEKRELNA
ncbi:MAG: hypothetical protein LCH92_16080 [Proteobacteria bacterium]|nr:hypothetical protein [Pseudomonadota bacterium]